MVVIIGVCALGMSVLTVAGLLRLPQIWRQGRDGSVPLTKDPAAVTKVWLAHLRALPAAMVAAVFLSLAAWAMFLNGIGWIPDSWVIGLSLAWILATLVSLSVLVFGRPSAMAPPGQRNHHHH